MNAFDLGIGYTYYLNHNGGYYNRNSYGTAYHSANRAGYHFHELELRMQACRDLNNYDAGHVTAVNVALYNATNGRYGFSASQGKKMKSLYQTYGNFHGNYYG